MWVFCWCQSCKTIYNQKSASFVTSSSLKERLQLVDMYGWISSSCLQRVLMQHSLIHPSVHPSTYPPTHARFNTLLLSCALLPGFTSLPSVSLSTGSWVTHLCAHMQMGPQWYSFHFSPLPKKINICTIWRKLRKHASRWWISHDICLRNRVYMRHAGVTDSV